MSKGKSNAKKPWLFKIGNRSTCNRREVKLETNVEKRLFERLPNDLYIAAKGASVGKILPTILRPSIILKLYNDMRRMNLCGETLMTLPGWGQKVLLLAIIPVPPLIYYI